MSHFSTDEPIGNLPHPDDFRLDDFLKALQRCHDLHPPVAPRVTVEMMNQVVALTHQANQEAGRDMKEGALVAWAMTVGILAERQRRWRSQRGET